ncbi:MAG: RhuM family protein [Sulfurovaceae bacterium]
MSDIVIYENGNVALNATVENETIWLSQKQMELLFDRERSVITKHINNIFKEQELDKNSVCAKFAHTAQDGKVYDVQHYSLDVIISVGYRVKSKQGTQFRIWANKVLKDYLIKGYALNKDRLQQQKLNELTQILHLIQQGLNAKELSTNEAKGFAEIISNYAKSWAVLNLHIIQSHNFYHQIIY